jgi:MFS family permease
MTRWLSVLLLLVAYALSFVDRQILGLLVDDVRGDLGVDDVRMGLLMGPAFGVFYALLGLPCGMLADRVRRTRLIAAGLLLWTGATLASGLAQSFTALALARMLVGVGEAALVPAAVSMIADAFGPRERALPLAVFTAGISVGAGLALLLGGGLVALARGGLETAPLIGGWLGSQAPWRSVMILAGAAGVPLALVFFVWPEPPRGAREASAANQGLWSFLRRERALFVPLLLATSLLYILANAWSAWLPSLFIRRFDWLPAAAGARLGGVVLVCALCGTLAGGVWAATLALRGRADASLFVMTAGAALLVPAAFAAALGGSATASLVGVACLYAAMSLCFGVATAGLVAATPAALRGRMVALYLLLGNLAGLGLGPPAVGALLDHGFGDPTQVGPALALIALPTALPGALLLNWARRRFAAAPPDNG